MSAKLSFSVLNKQHHRQDFQNAYPALENYLKTQARQDMKRNVAVSYVLTQNEQNQILAYYSLSAFSIACQDLPLELSKKLPRYPRIPCILLGRLAVDQRFQGQGYGKLALIDALKRAFENSQSIGAYALVVDAIDEKAQAYYLKYQFIPFLQSLQLFLPMQTIGKLLKTQNT